MESKEVIDLMESSQTEQEWNDNCEIVKGRCDGYPPFWFKEIIQSGLAERVAAKWGGDDRIHILTVYVTD